MSLRKQIVEETLHLLGEDTKFVRLATLTTFIHALIFTAIIIRYSRLFVSEAIVETFLDIFGVTGSTLSSLDGGVFLPVIIIGLVLAIGYAILPPIGEAAMIIYLDEGRQQGTLSLTKGFSRFFPMFELHGAISLLSIATILFMVIRMRSIGILESGMIIALLVIWITITLLTTIFFSYAKILISIEGMGFFDAIKRSTTLAMEHLGITVQFVVITFLLSIRFIVNILILVGFPVLLIYLGTLFGLDDIIWLKYLFILVMLGLVVLAAYIEGIIEAFFIVCWWKVYQQITKDNEQGTMNE